LSAHKRTFTSDIRGDLSPGSHGVRRRREKEMGGRHYRRGRLVYAALIALQGPAPISTS